MPEIGKLLVLAGAVLVLLGIVLWSGFGGSWLGRLPGDIRIERDLVRIYIPLVSMLLLSVALSLLLYLLNRFR